MIDVVANAMVARLQQQLIAARVDAGGDALVEAVYTQAEYTAIPETSMVTPSLAVIYNGYTPRATPGNNGTVPNVALVGLSFLVVINVASALSTNEADGLHDAVSPVFDAVLHALLGFRPAKGMACMSLEPAPGAAVSDAGFGYYPMSFSTAATYRGNP